MLPTKFQRRRLKCEKLTDDGRQKLTLPLARWPKKGKPPIQYLNTDRTKLDTLFPEEIHYILIFSSETW
jgi:hypothetical protein